MNSLKQLFILFYLIFVAIHVFAQTNEAEKNFNDELNQFRQFAVSQYQFPLHIVKYWSSDSKNMIASALQRDFQVIQVYGGVYRNLSLGGFRLALCHELGHKVGGEPFIQINPSGIESTVNRIKLSAEGQADYFAPTCLQKYMTYINQIPSTDSSNQFTAFCGANSSCDYMISASWDLVQLLASLQTPKAALQLWPYQDNFVTPTTLNGLQVYPNVQCRFQTFVAAILGQDRPSCWYHPSR